MCEKVNAIYGHGKPLSEVVIIFDETGIAKKELLKAIRSSSEIVKINIDSNGINSFITIQEIEVPKNANDLFFRDGIKLQGIKSK